VVRKPLKPCNEVGCNNLTRNKYCKKHEYKQTEKNRFYDRFVRDKKASSFYKSKAWRMTREQALARDKGLCQRCLKNKKITMADMVDHIIPIKVNWELRLVLSNLQSLCNACHRVKTAEDVKKYRTLHSG
jgi:5-methylcytosine-specific restriction enzyme A